MNKPITVLLAIAVMTSFWAFGDAQAFRLITQEMVEKEQVVETDLIRTADNFIILFDTSGSTNQLVPGKNTTKIQAAKNLLKERNAWFPMVQALYTGVLGWALALGLYQAVARIINAMMASQLEAGQQVCRLLPHHYQIALALTCGAAVISAGLAGLRSARIEPSESLRDL